MRAAKRNTAPRFGVGEWYGFLSANLSRDAREKLNGIRTDSKGVPPKCPFRMRSDGDFISCNKRDGVCSLKLYGPGEAGEGVPVGGAPGALRVTCPNRFYEAGVLETWIGEELLGTSKPLSVSEVDFLQHESEKGEDLGESVGRIDRVLMQSGNSPFHWCAVEMQAVYFSGKQMAADFEAAASLNFENPPFPVGVRRPDYRSSGPKRLMPQLQIKVPTLRRWGKKMAVVVDESFFAALGRMDAVPHPSNADIAWFVVGFEEGPARARLKPAFVRFTTLERAVEGLTAGVPVSLPEFERRIKAKLKVAAL